MKKDTNLMTVIWGLSALGDSRPDGGSKKRYMVSERKKNK